MKNCMLLLMLIFFTHQYGAQITSNLNQNNVNATISNSGTFFNNSAISTPGYEVPKNSGKHCVYAASFWYAGLNDNDELRLSAQTYQPNQDLFPGPFSNNDSYNAPEFVTKYNQIWTISSDQIMEHIIHYNDPGYTVPNEISTWPGNGDVSLGVSEQLAPFVDLNNDGFYIPEDGDYPDIKGCMASYLIMNDASSPHGSGGAIMGIEVHQMFYQYESDDYLNRTTFLEQKIINRGAENLHDVYTSFFVDADIGNYSDDYAGCDSSRNMMFAYNGDTNDESVGGSTGYGSETPSLGVLCLSDHLAAANIFTNGSDPSTPITVYNLMKGLWGDGSSIYHGGSGIFGDPGVSNIPTTFTYSDNPNDPMGWSEVTESNPPGDRRIFMSSSIDSLVSQAEWIQNYAVIQAPEGSAQESVNYLIQKADSAIAFYQNPSSDCDLFVSIDELKQSNIAVYPNPSLGNFHISLPHSMNSSILKITNSEGRLVHEKMLNQSTEFDVNIDQPKGVYLLTIDNGQSILSKKIILK